MNELIDIATDWYMLPLGALTFLLTFGFAPGMALRLLVMIYPKGDPRRHELIAQLYVLGRVERLLFVGEQLETALTEGILSRYNHWRRIRGEVHQLDRRRIRARRHWARLAWDTVGAFSWLAICIIASDLLPIDGLLSQNLLWWTALAVVLRYTYAVTVWSMEWVLVTDQRILMTTGVFGTKVLVLPIAEVTDLTFKRSLAGRMFGYGTVFMESAGQVQALNRIKYLPRPEILFDTVADLAFGRE